MIIDLLGRHPVQHEASCVSWGYEAIAKFHGKLDFDQSPIQSEYPSGLGFEKEDRDRFYQKYGIKTEKRSVSSDELKAVLREKREIEFPLIISVFYRATADYLMPNRLVCDKHIFLSAQSEGKGCFVTRIFKSDQILTLSFPQLWAIHSMTQSHPDYRPQIDVLIHTC